MQIDNQIEILQQALKYQSYKYIADQTLAVIDATEGIDNSLKIAIRAMAYAMGAKYPDQANMILHDIATETWESIGISNSAPLTLEQRAVIIDIIMAVSRVVIQTEADRLAALVASDTTLAEGWAD